MDSANLFETRTTYWLLRLEFAAALVVCSVLLLLHARQANWWHAALLFAYIDVIGYLPGAVAYHRSRTKRISRVYYVLYNTMHSFLSAGAVALLWAALFGWEWALLALPIHLCGDRSLFGNFMKPFTVRFEPVSHPAYLRLRSEIKTMHPEVPATPSAPPDRASVAVN
jgi:hypothetical protein